MGLVLSSQDVARFTALQEALLTPLQYESVDAWCAAVLRRAEVLFEADRSAFLLPLGGHFHYVSESVDPQYLKSFQDRISGVEPGAVRVSDELTDEAFEKRRSHALEVWSIPMLARLAGRPLEDFPVYHEAVRPAGITYGAVLTIPLPTGEAFLGLAHPRPETKRFSEANELELARMVLPAFKAGVGTLARLEPQKSAVEDALDGLGQPVLVVGADGRLLHRSVRLQELLMAEPEAEALLHAMAGAARRVLRPLGRGTEVPIPGGARDIRTVTARYLMHATGVPAGMMGRDPVALVLLERLTPPLPSATDLVAHFGLTPREAAVALLLAQGMSNVEIGRRLGLSPHTVRHHAEWVFAKLGVHSRKALGLRLLAGMAEELGK